MVNPPPATGRPQAQGPGGLIRRTINLCPGEGPALIGSAAFFFLILTSYYIIRPIRDEMGIAGGVEYLAYLFTGTLLGTLLLHPLYTWMVSRLPRRRFVPYAYRFFIANLVLFYLVLRGADAAQSIWIGRAFYIWVSVFNLFIVSVFWSFMTDIYHPAQSKRLFGVIAVGGTAGALLGSTITAFLVELAGPLNLLLVSGLFLELAAQASRLLGRYEVRLAEAAQRDYDQINTAGDSPAGPGSGAKDLSREVIGGGIFEGIRHVVRSPYLLGIASLVAFFAVVSTFLYFQVANIVAEAFLDDPIGRTRLFARRDLAVNMLTLGTQIFLTGRILRWGGVGAALAFLPAVSMIGFGVLGFAPVLAVAIGFEVLRRAGNFAIQRPAREVLYTVLPRTDKYKAKNFNDTFVYRAGDQVGAWSHTAMGWLGLGTTALAFAMVPVSLLWLGVALWLGGSYRTIERQSSRRTRTGEEGQHIDSPTTGA